MKERELKVPISIDHIARIEGKAGIEVALDNEAVKNIKINVFEGPRFFEAITIGKPVEEAVAIFPRICSFCAAAHKITALQAAENALDIIPSKQTKLLRELMYLGDQIESHTLHLFLLALPDFLGYPDIFQMAKDYPAEVKIALNLKDIGEKIQVLLGSRFMHQENAIIGGFGKLPSKNSLKKIRDRLKSLMIFSELALGLFLKYELWPEPASSRNHLAIKPYDETYGVLGDTVKTSDGFEFPVGNYKKHITEEVKPYSFAKHSQYKNQPFMTGAISRITLFPYLLTGITKERAVKYKEMLDPNNPLSNNIAQALELIYFMEKAKGITETLINTLKEEKRIKIEITKPGKGISISEAPRGMLAYTIELNKKGVITGTDIITPTAMFLPLIEQDLKRQTEGMIQNNIKDPKIISQKLETIVRAYDPCISCSVHVTKTDR
jgi:sulfhydrogenase subunit alpha